MVRVKNVTERHWSSRSPIEAWERIVNELLSLQPMGLILEVGWNVPTKGAGGAPGGKKTFGAASSKIKLPQALPIWFPLGGLKWLMLSIVPWPAPLNPPLELAPEPETNQVADTVRPGPRKFDESVVLA